MFQAYFTPNRFNKPISRFPFRQQLILVLTPARRFCPTWIFISSADALFSEMLRKRYGISVVGTKRL
jgi:hypothetical protein